MSTINQKRDDLQSFIKEQIFGPGIHGVQMFRKQEFNDLETLPLPKTYSNEIINTAPLVAGYSTGILFPGNNKLKRNEGDETQNENNEENNLLDTTSENETEIADLADEKILDAEIDQFYPKFNGFSFAVDQSFFSENSKLPLKVEFRTYQKISARKFRDQEIGILINKTEKETFDELIQETKDINQYYEIIEQNGHSKIFLKLKEDSAIRQEGIINTLKEFTESRIEKKLIDLLQKYDFKGFYNGIRLSTIRQKIAEEIKVNSSFTSQANFEEIDKLLKKEEFIQRLEKLFNLNAGLWESKTHILNLEIRNIKLKGGKTIITDRNTDDSEIYLITENGEEQISFSKIFEEGSKGNAKVCLSLNLQITKDTRHNNELFFIKCQFLNNSTKFKEDSKRHYSPNVDEVNERSFFGFTATVEGDFIKPYNEVKTVQLDKDNEDDIVKYNYRELKNFAVGYNCSVGWNEEGNKVFINYLPYHDTPDIDPVPRNKENIDEKTVEAPLFNQDSKAQEFKFLSEYNQNSNDDIVKELYQFVEKYKEWIELKRKKSIYNNLLAENELNKCEKDYHRMKKNIGFLHSEGNENKIKVFRLMNSAMFIQLLHKEKGGKTGADLSDNKNFNYSTIKDYIFEEGKSAGWRAFQLAFILLNLDGIWQHEDDDEWKYRNRVTDLVWFPTGGGKTEAYLGLIALFILNRRMEFKDAEHKGKGVTALMRYTLRLLTLQQFQRSSLLILALEKLRAENQTLLGEEPISIGLWVGSSSLPNKRSELTTQFNNYENDKENNLPVQKCSWCNSRLKILRPDGKQKRTEIYCSNNNCTFSKPVIGGGTPLPFRLCDEDIYEYPPSLLFATVDKFAQLANKVSIDQPNNDSRRLFGKGGLNYLPPDLIIQDELHLLLGPLGSAVAQFEAAIDIMSLREDGTRPKVITSTATTRNTALQIEALYNREVNIFPKQGVECDDAYFSFYKRKFNQGKSLNESKRRYLGIMPTGRSHVWMQFRLLSIMMVHRSLFELDNIEQNDGQLSEDAINAMNNYHSILNYFNSTREVGKSQAQIQTYLKKEIGKIWENVIYNSGLLKIIYRENDIEESELTGRLKGSEVKDNLDEVEKPWKPENRFAHKNDDGETINGTVPPEIIAATNMISVGLDVGRFNQILMNSMPRNTAEYIQASSRVARNKKGLVITLHHPFKTRDMSHFEQFKEFHQKLYSYVEPISITPFTKKSLNRYFSLVVATIVRHCFDDFAPNNSVNQITEERKDEILSFVGDYFEKRLQNVPQDLQMILNEDYLNEILNYTDKMIQQWNDKCTTNQALLFKHNNEESLYYEVGDLNLPEELSCWEIPGSLRIVEPGGVIHIKN
tara:strand:- start:2593 stop:6645 length:4053 start_codon:yes stop_codon:yes gene_type:complete